MGGILSLKMYAAKLALPNLISVTIKYQITIVKLTIVIYRSKSVRSIIGVIQDF